LLTEKLKKAMSINENFQTQKNLIKNNQISTTKNNTMKKLLILFILPAFGFSQDIILNGSVKVEGGLEINSPQQSNQAVTKEYVDQKVSLLNINMDFINDFVGDGTKLYVRHWDTEGTTTQNVSYELVDGDLKYEESYVRSEIINPQMFMSDNKFNLFDSYALKSIHFSSGYVKVYQDYDQDGNFELENENVFDYIECGGSSIPYTIDTKFDFDANAYNDFHSLISKNKISNINETTILITTRGIGSIGQDYSYIFEKISDNPRKYLITDLEPNNFLSPISNQKAYEGFDHDLYASNNYILQEVSSSQAESLYNQWQATDNNCGLTFSEWYNTVITQN
jgi:hypothetical protein